jgi:hypothetical protein
VAQDKPIPADTAPKALDSFAMNVAMFRRLSDLADFIQPSDLNLSREDFIKAMSARLLENIGL